MFLKGVKKKLEIKDFKVEQIYKMNVGSRSHVTQPYYVEIIEVGSDYIVTNIPGEHSCVIKKASNWDYHIPRMKYVSSQNKSLVKNQKLI